MNWEDWSSIDAETPDKQLLQSNICSKLIYLVSFSIREQKPTRPIITTTQDERAKGMRWDQFDKESSSRGLRSREVYGTAFERVYKQKLKVGASNPISWLAFFSSLISASLNWFAAGLGNLFKNKNSLHITGRRSNIHAVHWSALGSNLATWDERTLLSQWLRLNQM